VPAGMPGNAGTYSVRVTPVFGLMV